MKQILDSVVNKLKTQLEALGFNEIVIGGEILTVPVADGETVLGEMSEDEQKLFFLRIKIDTDHEQIHEDITEAAFGDDIEKMQKLEVRHQAIKDGGKLVNELLWNLISERLQIKGTIGIRNGGKVVSVPEKEDAENDNIEEADVIMMIIGVKG